MKIKKQFVLLLLLLNAPHIFGEKIDSDVFYKHLASKKLNQSIHILFVDPKNVDIKIGIANNKCSSAQTVSSLAKEHNAIAAINAGFFDFGYKNKIKDAIVVALDRLGYSIYKAYPAHTLCINNKNYSTYALSSGAIGWNNKSKKPIFGTIKSKISLAINEQQYLVEEFNKPYVKGKTALYSDTYDLKTPFCTNKVIELLIENNKIKQISMNTHSRNNIPA